MQHILKTAIVSLLLVASSAQAAPRFGYEPGIADSMPSTSREFMRDAYREYTCENMTTGYVYTCGYADVLLALGKSYHLSPEDIMNLAQENVEFFAKEYRTCIYERSYPITTWLLGIPNPSAINVCSCSGANVDKAILIRQLIYLRPTKRLISSKTTCFLTKKI